MNADGHSHPAFEAAAVAIVTAGRRWRPLPGAAARTPSPIRRRP